MTADLDAIFKAYDIRGVYPDQIDDSVAYRVGNAFVGFSSGARVLVGRDARPSSQPLVAAFIEGATLAGADVVDLGLASTDLCYFASGHLDAPAAMFTASHNPAEYNGIKLCRAGAAPIGVETGLAQIKAVVAAGLLERAEEAGHVEQLDLLPAFVTHVRSFVDLDALQPLKVVADTANGIGGLVVPAVFNGLPLGLTMLFGELDGTFPNHPADPIQPENLKDLQRVVLDVEADVGLAFDGDADRVFLVDDRVLQVEGFEGVDDETGGGHATKPFVVGRDDVPGRPFRARMIQGAFEGVHVVVPIATLRDVGEGELPVLRRRVDARQQTTLLLPF